MATESSSLNTLKHVYKWVMEDVIKNVREEFLNEGVDLQVLDELKQLWSDKVDQTGAVDRPSKPHTSDPIPPPPLLKASPQPSEKTTQPPTQTESVIQLAPARTQQASPSSRPPTVILPSSYAVASGGTSIATTATTIPSQIPIVTRPTAVSQFMSPIMMNPAMSAMGAAGLTFPQVMMTPQGAVLMPLSAVMALQQQQQQQQQQQAAQALAMVKQQQQQQQQQQQASNKTDSNNVEQTDGPPPLPASWNPNPKLSRDVENSSGLFLLPSQSGSENSKSESRNLNPENPIPESPYPNTTCALHLTNSFTDDNPTFALCCEKRTPSGHLSCQKHTKGIRLMERRDKRRHQRGRVIDQLDGAGGGRGESSSEDDSEGDDDTSEDEIEAEVEDSPLGSDDDTGSDNAEEDVFETPNVIVCQFEKVYRVKNKWKFNLRDGVMRLAGHDYIFHKATGEADW